MSRVHSGREPVTYRSHQGPPVRNPIVDGFEHREREKEREKERDLGR